MPKPKISVLMPVYNTKIEYLKEAIESVLHQSYTDFEFIMLNDGSTDENIEKVIKSYNDTRIKYYYQENQGIVLSRNRLIDLSQGEYIALNDHDDISHVDRFKKELKILEKNPNIDIVSSWYNVFPENRVVKLVEKPRLFDFLYGNCQILHSGAMMRKSFLKKYELKYKLDFATAEDYELWTRAVRYTEMYNIQEVLFEYRKHEAQLSKIMKDIQQSGAERASQNLLDFITLDRERQLQIYNIFHSVPKDKFIERIFSIKNSADKKHKIIMFLGIKIHIKRVKKYATP